VVDVFAGETVVDVGANKSMKLNSLFTVAVVGFNVVPQEPVPQSEFELRIDGFSLIFANGSLNSYSTLIYGFNYFLGS
jgi:hypothetical protein